MKANANTEEQREVRSQFVENFKNVYSIIGKHDEKEQIMMQMAGSAQLQAPQVNQKAKAKKPKKLRQKEVIGQKREEDASMSGSESDYEEEAKNDEVIQPKKGGGGFFGAISGIFGGGSKAKAQPDVQPQQQVQVQSNMSAMPRSMMSRMDDDLSHNLFQAQRMNKKAFMNKK